MERIAESGKTWTIASIAKEVWMGVHRKDWYNPGEYKLRCFVDEIFCRQYKDEEGVDFLVDRFLQKYNS